MEYHAGAVDPRQLDLAVADTSKSDGVYHCSIEQPHDQSTPDKPEIQHGKDSL